MLNCHVDTQTLSVGSIKKKISAYQQFALSDDYLLAVIARGWIRAAPFILYQTSVLSPS
jgi:hypothetical protein